MYKYCCTSCGKRFDGEKIAFDLVDMLELDLHIAQDVGGVDHGGRLVKKMDSTPGAEVSKGDGERKDYMEAAGAGPGYISGKDAEKKNENAVNRDYAANEIPMQGRTNNQNDSDYIGKKEGKKLSYKAVHAFITPEELKEIAEAGGKQLIHNEETSITISLHQFFSCMTIGIKGKGDYADLPRDEETIVKTLTNSLTLGEKWENAEIIAKKYWEAIHDRFHLKEDAKYARDNLDPETESKAISEIENKADNYEASFVIKPDFYDNSKHLYTIKIKKEGGFFDFMRDKGTFRGYCTNPDCRKPVLLHTGKYPHRVVGMLGAMSAGKTSMIQAMTVEIEKNSKVLGTEHVDGTKKLYDDAAKDRDIDYILYTHDWAVNKTAAETREGSYNASFLLTDQNDSTQKVILTLADIAGEKCYDRVNNKLATDAFIKFPLIENCDAYLICACINQKGYGNAEGEKVAMPPAAIKSIATDIYDTYYKNKAERIPPLCIVMTKADMAKENLAAGGDDNPFIFIRPLKGYLFGDGLRILSSIYNAETDSNIRQSLKLCADTYEAMSKKTYTAILSAAAMGREAVNFHGDINEIGPDMPHSDLGSFRRTRILNVWEWILKVCGVVPVEKGGYKFEEVPSYLEYYSEDHSHVYNIDNWEKRLKAVRCIGINQANSDRMMFRASEEEIPWWKKWTLGEENARRARIKEVMPKDLSKSIDINTKYD